MSESDDVALRSFHYRAATGAGQVVTGAVDAADAVAARQLLEAMGLEVREVEPEHGKPPRAGRFDHGSFMAFNQQLAALTSAGLPVESGLRMIAAETRKGSLAAAIKAVADDVESGTPLGEAFAARRSSFPALYGRLIDAGIKSGDLPGMLYNLGRHLELLAKLRATLWQAIAYPLTVLLALAAVLLVLSLFIFPQFQHIYEDFDTDLPELTILLIQSSAWLPYVMGAIVVAILASPLIWWVARKTGLDVPLADGFGLVLPLIGGILRRNLLARWLDTVKLSVQAGLDLPRALGLAADAMGSPSLRNDTQRMVEHLEQGKPLITTPRLSLVPPSVTAAMHHAARQNALPETLATLTDLYRQQAETRVGLVQVVLMPFLLIFLAFMIGGIVYLMFLPLLKLMQSIM